MIENDGDGEHTHHRVNLAQLPGEKLQKDVADDANGDAVGDGECQWPNSFLYQGTHPINPYFWNRVYETWFILDW